ncbi:MAG: UDP-glucose/GDP-mannose dehydrogenase family protein [Thermoproteota archaeon]
MSIVTIVGMGFVGLTTAAIFAEKGITVYGVDNDVKKIKKISQAEAPFFEPELGPLLKNVITSGTLKPTMSLQTAIKNSSLIFICVGTPMKPDGSVNLDYIDKVSIEIGRCLKSANHPVVCVKSTVPPKTTEDIVASNIKKMGGNFGIAMTPEFLREGSAVTDSRNPHLIVIGSNDDRTHNIVEEFFRSVYGQTTRILHTNIVSAELIKYANNSFLATKISFVNTIANVCNRIPGADVDVIAQAIGADPRIGPQFLNAGPGYGGSCFPKDVSGFINYCKKIGYDPILLRATDAVNKRQVCTILDLLRQNLKNIRNKPITVLGTAFKKDTDDIRESVSIKLVKELNKSGARVSIHDPMALENAKQVLGNKVRYATSTIDAIRNASAVILMTDWDEYKSLDRTIFLKHTGKCLVIDTRRILNIDSDKNVHYIALGRSQ